VAKNGVIHVVDNVLLPAAPPQTITQTAVATPQLSTLVTALQAAELTGTLSGTGPFTVFAPVNAAFAAALAPLLRLGDTVWVHDFHLFLLAAELRLLGCRARIGFFLHVPFPPRAVFLGLPKALAILEAMNAHDVIGVQTEDDAENLRAALAACGEASAAAKVGVFVSADGGTTWTLRGSTQTASVNGSWPYQAAFASGNARIIYVWGNDGYIAYSTDNGVNFTNKEPTNVTNSSVEILGICGGPTA
jgi:hypothetical protein